VSPLKVSHRGGPWRREEYNKIMNNFKINKRTREVTHENKLFMLQAKERGAWSGIFLPQMREGYVKENYSPGRPLIFPIIFSSRTAAGGEKARVHGFWITLIRMIHMALNF